MEERERGKIESGEVDGNIIMGVEWTRISPLGLVFLFGPVCCF